MPCWRLYSERLHSNMFSPICILAPLSTSPWPSPLDARPSARAGPRRLHMSPLVYRVGSKTLGAAHDRFIPLPPQEPDSDSYFEMHLDLSTNAVSDFYPA